MQANQSTGILDFFKAEETGTDPPPTRRHPPGVICQRMVSTIAGSMTPAVEIMINTQTVQKLIEENRLDKLGAAIETGTDDGMINFNQASSSSSALQVSEQKPWSKATNPQALEMNFKGIFLDEAAEF